MAARLTLLRWISLRHLRDEPGRALLTLAGVALGVAVYLAIRLANASALASFSSTVDAVAGRANLQVTGGTGGFDERLFRRVQQTPGGIGGSFWAGGALGVPGWTRRLEERRTWPASLASIFQPTSACSSR